MPADSTSFFGSAPKGFSVEIGQLLFVAAVLLLIALARQMSLTMPGWAGYATPYAIGTVAMFWAIERVGSF